MNKKTRFWTTKRLIFWVICWTILTWGCLSTQAFAQLVSTPPLMIREEGVDVARATRALDFVGTSITCVNSAGVITCTVTGGSGYATIDNEDTPLTARTTVNFTGAGVNCVDNAGLAQTDCTIAGGSGSVNVVDTTIVMTAGSGVYSATVVSQAWVTATSVILCTQFGTTADGLTVEQAAAANLTVTTSDRVIGVGFNINVVNPYGSHGTHRIHCTGA